MRLQRLTVRGFRNLADATLAVPHAGAVLLGANGQGKTSLLEAIAYPVLFRSFRTVLDAELVRFGDGGFHVELGFLKGDGAHEVATTFRALGRKKQLQVDGVPTARLVDAAGAWLAVVFAPDDVRLASGPATGRRLFLDRTLALSDPGYLAALARYRAALAQRNAALRQGRPDLAAAFNAPLAEAGAIVVARRTAWVAGAVEPFAAALVALGEHGGASTLAYHGHPELADPGAWPERLAQAAARDLARRMTTVGPHRDDLELRLGGHALRDFGSTGQQRSAAIALKLLELETIERATGRCPALLLDDVFAELDPDRQARLSRRLFGGRPAQVFVSAPREDELPADLELPVWRVAAGAVSEER
ncbi:MAG: DNA replication and repair protein RecF [Gemmatimonadetes bacterium]|nr:DNA replication and repair protein RecF [Gemmatimonadota bacterium]MBK7349308.1 DNA replication and repair protein RecF [Gemmatimonadota bacterium]MBK7714877.1 DNA replication and repair protein RecF [Gemmatimonadota bacterium]MBK7783936.1 DNA replication and repair protein RecF [Gemmatimonadota bacterium]MBK9068017.1 DNA replication and repair protein RecF [Gemmatimonadota bacterium]